jgi:hypothetical protein
MGGDAPGAIRYGLACEPTTFEFCVADAAIIQLEHPPLAPRERCESRALELFARWKTFATMGEAGSSGLFQGRHGTGDADVNYSSLGEQLGCSHTHARHIMQKLKGERPVRLADGTEARVSYAERVADTNNDYEQSVVTLLDRIDSISKLSLEGVSESERMRAGYFCVKLARVICAVTAIGGRSLTDHPEKVACGDQETTLIQKLRRAVDCHDVESIVGVNPFGELEILAENYRERLESARSEANSRRNHRGLYSSELGSELLDAEYQLGAAAARAGLAALGIESFGGLVAIVQINHFVRPLVGERAFAALMRTVGKIAEGLGKQRPSPEYLEMGLPDRNGILWITALNEASALAGLVAADPGIEADSHNPATRLLVPKILDAFERAKKHRRFAEPGTTYLEAEVVSVLAFYDPASYRADAVKFWQKYLGDVGRDDFAQRGVDLIAEFTPKESNILLIERSIHALQQVATGKIEKGFTPFGIGVYRLPDPTPSSKRERKRSRS